MLKVHFLFLTITDNEPPVISGIPPPQYVYTPDTNSTVANVSWTPPTAEDNSGEAVTLTSDYSPGDTFPIGNITVTYTAVDTYGNQAVESFDVLVTGELFISRWYLNML